MGKNSDKLLRMLASLMPVRRNWIVFDSFNGRGFGDSPGAIAQEIINRKLPYKLFWLSQDPSAENWPDGIIPVRKQSVLGVLITASAKVWIDNVKTGITLKKKANQFYIQTWHGGGLPLKCVEGQSKAFLPDDYLAISQRDSLQTDMIVADNNLVADIYRKFFWYPDHCEVACIGLPKNDVLYNPGDCADIKERCFGTRDALIALYAPTFRDDGHLEAFDISLQQIHDKLRDKYNQRWIIAVRLHPNMADKSHIFTYNEDIVDVTAFPEAQQLILASDMLITDYSSIMSDYLAMDKPVFLYIPDYKHYTDSCRNLSPLYEQLPFPKCYTMEQLLVCIGGFDKEAYLDELKRFKSTAYISYDDGRASTRVVSRIVGL